MIGLGKPDVRPPAHGAKLKSIDTSEAEKIEGVRSVRAFNSSGGEMVILVEIDGLAAIDRALVDKEYNRIASGMFPRWNQATPRS